MTPYTNTFSAATDDFSQQPGGSENTNSVSGSSATFDVLEGMYNHVHTASTTTTVQNSAANAVVPIADYVGQTTKDFFVSSLLTINSSALGGGSGSRRVLFGLEALSGASAPGTGGVANNAIIGRLNLQSSGISGATAQNIALEVPFLSLAAQTPYQINGANATFLTANPYSLMLSGVYQPNGDLFVTFSIQSVDTSINDFTQVQATVSKDNLDTNYASATPLGNLFGYRSRVQANSGGSLNVSLDNFMVVPEPTSIVLLAAGGVLLLARRSRRRAGSIRA